MYLKFISVSAFAASLLASGQVFSAAGWTLNTSIHSLETTANGTEIRLLGHNTGVCEEITESGVALTWARIGANQENAEQMMSVALTAFSTGKNIDIYCAEGAWPEVGHIRIK